MAWEEGTTGSVTLRQLRLNPSAIGELFAGQVTFQEGTIQEATLTIDGAGEGNDHHIRLEGIDIRLAAPGEEGIIFYDAIDGVDGEGRTPASGKAIQLGKSTLETRCPLVNNTGLSAHEDRSSKGNSAAFSGGEMSRLLGQFTIEMSRLRIFLQGVQAHEGISVLIPKLLIYKVPGSDQRGTMNLPEGFQVQWHSQEDPINLGNISYLNLDFVVKEGIHVTGRAPSLCLPVELVRRLREMMLEYRLDWEMAVDRGGETFLAKDSSSLGWTMDVEEVACFLNLSGDQLGFTGKRVTKKTDSLEELTIHGLCFNCGASDDCQLNCDTISVKFTDTGMNINASPILLSQVRISELRDKLEQASALLPGRRVDQDLPRVPGGGLITLRVESLQLASVILQGRRLDGQALQVEINYSPLQLSMHSAQVRIEASFDDSSFQAQVSRASIYVSLRPTAGDKPEVPDPFNDVCLIIEGREFIACKTNPEDYFLMRATAVDTCQEHIYLSADSLSLSGPLVRALLESRTSSAGLGEKRLIRCITISLKQVSLVLTDPRGIIEASDIEGLFLLNGTSMSIFDCRFNAQQVAFREEVLLKSVLTASLDPHFKSVILTGCAGRAISIFCCGLLFTIPLFHPALDDLSGLVTGISEDPVQGPSKFPLLYFQADLCSYGTLLPENYQRRIPPHVLYIEGVRLVGEEPRIVFLTEGELFLSPGVGLTRPVTGLFPEGHNFWIEQNYEPIFRFDFVTMTLVTPKIESTENKASPLVTIGIEDNEMTIDLCVDSLQVLERLVGEYAELLKEQRGKLPDAATANPNDCALDKGSILEGLDETRPQGIFPLDEEIVPPERLDEEDEWRIEDEFCALSPSGNFNLNELIELPFFDDCDEENDDDSRDARFKKGRPRFSEDHESLEGEGAPTKDFDISQLEIEEDFFNRHERKAAYPTVPDAFPFTLPVPASSGEPVQSLPKLQVRLTNFNAKVRLLEGRQWDPNRPQHVIERYSYGGGGSSSVASYASSLAHFGASPSSTCASTSIPHHQPPTTLQGHGGNHHQRRSGITVATTTAHTTSSESRWSHLQGASCNTTGHTSKSNDHIVLQLDDISAEIDFSNPFPVTATEGASGEADLMMITGVRLVIRDVAVLDQVRASRWRHLLRGATTGHSAAEALVKLSLETLYVPMKKPSEDDNGQDGQPCPLAPEDQLESIIRVQLNPLRAYIDQDTLAFLLKFFTSQSRRESSVSAEERGGSSFFIRTLARSLPLCLSG